MSPNPKLEVQTMSVFYGCFFSIFTATLHIWRPFLHTQPDTRQALVTRDPLIKGLERKQLQYGKLKRLC